jgi:hypothetical protein
MAKSGAPIEDQVGGVTLKEEAGAVGLADKMSTRCSLPLIYKRCRSRFEKQTDTQTK